MIQNRPVFRPSSGRIEGCPEKLRYGTGTDCRPINEPKSRRLLTYEWILKEEDHRVIIADQGHRRDFIADSNAH